MQLLEKISGVFGRYMAVIVLIVAALSLFVPASALWIQTSWVNNLLMIVMFGMGLTLSPHDFALVFTRPRDILLGCICQFLIMPALAYGLCTAFPQLPMATVPGAIFSVWHNISGALLAGIYRKWKD